MIRQLIKSSPLVVSLISALAVTPLLFRGSPVLAQMMHSPMNNPSMTGSSTPSFSDVMLRMGSRGEKVSQVQTLLNQQGFYNGSINGVFDQSTRSAVMAFQRSHKLRVDGIVGRQTITALSKSRS